jgi:hypothetical protein
MDGFMIIAWVGDGIIALVALMKQMNILFDSSSAEAQADVRMHEIASG